MWKQPRSRVLRLRAAFLLVSMPAWPVGAAPPTAARLTATPLTAGERVQGTKAPTSRLARTDPALLTRTDAARIPVLVKLDYDSLATYAGDLATLGATSPSVTGRALTTDVVNGGAYASHVGAQEAKFLTALRTRVPQAQVSASLRTVYGGVAMTLPANQVANVLAIPGVVAVQADHLRRLLTDSSNAFIGSPTIWNALGGQETAGQGLLFASLDSGGWPEHPSFAANPALPPAPTDLNGDPLACNFGDNPLTPANDPFVCNNKLVGGQPFLDTYNAVIGGEFFPTSARDSSGHGTHTAVTAAGNANVSASILGIPRGVISGVAPGAAVEVLKVCGAQGCFASDTVVAVQRAILDGADVITAAFEGGTDPFLDPVELAFLDAYAAGVFVAVAAGNDGPAAGLVEHRGPWVTTVGATTQQRTFQSTLTLAASNGDTLTLDGASITAGVTSPIPVVRAADAPYSNESCTVPAPPGLFTGRIVACRRGPGRVRAGFNVFQGGAVGMILYNETLTPADVATDSHFLPTVHLPEGTSLLAFVAAHSGVVGSFTQGTATTGAADVLAPFSSQGPAGAFLKPDLTAPGVQIVAGHTPVPDFIEGGPPGNYFRAGSGTSMSAAHVAGAALLLRAQHPTWTPGQVKSALMTSANTNVTDELLMPANPFGRGAGRIDLNQAGRVGLTFDETAANFVAFGTSDLTMVDLNLPSINAPIMPGRLTTTRVATNVGDRRARYKATTSAQPGSQITVDPKSFTVRSGASVTLTVTIASSNGSGQEFGEIVLTPTQPSDPTLHIPVAFAPQQGRVTLTSLCQPTPIVARSGLSTCTVTAANTSNTDTTVDLETTLTRPLRIDSVAGGLPFKRRELNASGPLAGAKPGVPSIAPGSVAGYLPLDLFGVTPIPIGDEQILNLNVPPFVYNGVTYTRVGVDTNGYLVVGGGETADNSFLPVPLPNPARPNNVLAPFWTDLDGTGAPGIFATTLTDGVNTWMVVEWRVNLFGTNDRQAFQAWMGVNGVQDITYAYDPANLPSSPYDLLVGAENEDGSGGAMLPFNAPPTQDLRVTSTPPQPGGSFAVQFDVLGRRKGVGQVTTSMSTPIVAGITLETSTVEVVK